MIDVGVKCMKVILLLFNSIALLAGIALVGAGAYVRSQLLNYGSLTDPTFEAAPLLLIAIGAIIVCIACLGFYGTCAESRKVVIVYGFLLLIIFLLEVAAGLVGLALSAQVEILLEKHLHTTMNDDAGWNFLQENFKCCGVNGPNDWLEFYRTRDNNTVTNSTVTNSTDTNSTDTNSTNTNQLPYSGCVPTTFECNATISYSQGCFDKFVTFLKDEVYSMGAGVFTLAFVQLVGIILAFYVAKALKVEYEAMAKAFKEEYEAIK